MTPMKNLTAVGRFFLAIAIVAFGIQHFIYAETDLALDLRGPQRTIN